MACCLTFITWNVRSLFGIIRMVGERERESERERVSVLVCVFVVCVLCMCEYHPLTQPNAHYLMINQSPGKACTLKPQVHQHKCLQVYENARAMVTHVKTCVCARARVHTHTHTHTHTQHTNIHNYTRCITTNTIHTHIPARATTQRSCNEVDFVKKSLIMS